MAYKPAALVEGSTYDADRFCALFEREERRVAVVQDFRDTCFLLNMHRLD